MLGYAFSGCSGAILWPTLVRPAHLLVTWQTLVSRMSCLRHLQVLRFCLVPDAILRLYRAACNWWIFRAWPHPALHDFRLPLGNNSLLSNRLLDVERKLRWDHKFNVIPC
jgi:hypothetical protein